MQTTNLGVKPLGRGEEISATVQAEIAALKQYGKELRSGGPVNNMTAARWYRIASLNFARTWDNIHGTKREKALRAIYTTLKLPLE